tara:strand:- start:249 stop:902 length:654 start_codon:yes stop_codon:yes gene_type:complete
MEDLTDGQKEMLGKYIAGRETDRKGQLSKAWYGTTVSFHDKERVKALCKGPNDQSRFLAWDGDNKWWGTRSLSFVPALIDSNRWTPVGISSDLVCALHKEATRMSAFCDDNVVKKEDGEEYMDSDALPFVAQTTGWVHRPPIVFERVRRCPLCHGTPITQFLDCSCCDCDATAWVLCQACKCIHNPSKLARLNAGNFDEVVSAQAKPIVAAGFKCIC